VESIHLQYAFYLFSEQEDFRGAMSHFSQTKVDARLVISLFPDLLIQNSNSNIFAHEDAPKIKQILQGNIIWKETLLCR
jgi:hypothetical protein